MKFLKLKKMKLKKSRKETINKNVKKNLLMYLINLIINIRFNKVNLFFNLKNTVHLIIILIILQFQELSNFSKEYNEQFKEFRFAVTKI